LALLHGPKEALYKKKEDFVVLETFAGKTLAGKQYEPLFEYFAHMKDTAFRVVCDTYVTADSGTGIVHNAPGHGEDDYRVCLREGIVNNTNIPCPLDDRYVMLASVGGSWLCGLLTLGRSGQTVDAMLLL
jgi:isoleucyl-tRNA synthetase